jgi:nitrite reductase/ring-hydroxylating ferredoxin subunit
MAKLRQIAFYGKGGIDMVLCRQGAEVFALSNLCSHAYAFLSDGYIEGNEVFCPLHDGSFDLRTGEARHPPCDEAIATYAVKIEAGDVFVQARKSG